MRADRLIRITLLLQNEGKLTATELSRRLEVSPRTILRDMDALSAAGIPVYAERGNLGGWQLSEGYRTQLTGFKSDELSALLLSTHPQLLDDLGLSTSFQDARQKLLAASPVTLHPTIHSILSKIYIDGASWHMSDQDVTSLEHIQTAVFAERKLRFRYAREGKLDEIERTICPLGLVAKRSVWYVIGWTDEQEQMEIRTYRVSRIRMATPLDEYFIPPDDFELAAYWEQSTLQFRDRLPHYEVTIRARSGLLSRLKQERFIRILQTRQQADDWLELQIDFATSEYACNLLLALGKDAVVLQPLTLKQEIIDAARELLAAYE